MTAVPFDTLKLADRLQAGGFTPEQSRAAASALAEAMSGADLVTKGDLRETELRLDTKIEAARSDILRWMFAAVVGQTALIVGLLKFWH